MSTSTNIKINYMIIEQILKATDFYKNLVNEHEFFGLIFEQAKTGEIKSLSKDKGKRQVVFNKLADLTGLSNDYLSGDERIKLDIKCINKDLNYDDQSIETIDLDNDQNFIDEHGNEGHVYQGILYNKLLKNPLHLDYKEVYYKAISTELDNGKYEIEQGLKDIESLYSLRGLLMVILLNMTNELEFIDKADVFYDNKWDPYIIELNKPTDPFIAYSPKFVEIKKGLVQSIIMNLFDLGNKEI